MIGVPDATKDQRYFRTTVGKDARLSPWESYQKANIPSEAEVLQFEVTLSKPLTMLSVCGETGL